MDPFLKAAFFVRICNGMKLDRNQQVILHHSCYFYLSLERYLVPNEGPNELNYHLEIQQSIMHVVAFRLKKIILMFK